MFYSHDILTDRQHGVATIWYAKDPHFAFPGNLLYGVSRVYSQQCAYVLNDAEKVQSNMKLFYRLIAHNETDPQAGKSKPDQNILEDDPGFIANPNLPRFDFGEDVNLFMKSQSQMSSAKVYSQLSPIDKWTSSSRRASSLIGLNLPQSEGSSSLGLPSPFGPLSSAQKTGMPPVGVDPMNEQDDLDLMGVLELDIDAEGNVLGIVDHIEEPGLPPHPSRQADDNEIAGTRQERQPKGHHSAVNEDDYLMMEDQLLPDAEAFPGQQPQQQERIPETGSTLQRTVSTRQRRRPRMLAPDDVSQELAGRSVSRGLSTLWRATLQAIHSEIKYSAAFEDDEEEHGRHVRPRLEEATPQPFQDHDMGFLLGDDSMLPEMGMEGQPAMTDRMSSSLMPWNRTPSAQPPSSILGRGSKKRAGSHQITSSPKGSAIYPIERHSDPATGSHHGSDPDFGPGLADLADAEVTQDSQWMHAGLDTASGVFLTYLKEQANELGVPHVGDPKQDRLWIDFEDLAIPGKHPKNVAAQAFLHVLSLATKNRIGVEQLVEDNRPFGNISVGVDVGGMRHISLDT
ncbi:hypothetical protein SODALDRAFT_349072 [Sodiomyces alkalinus F11]|uniref:Rad21/Rec8-like protein N-terminal domain-containing protein n=1 Tax=Sodiomyces alkalinus (strain CBS 110278 / VKM F-3762 / F11) TaxID=1314773 RepID=A0A3N2Q2J8_SODAK|nr:hypothetical protein SODALDRAFT_349072 [Sodiomyces alkalinus F11]ROT40946.1 hypothetical protein SODALDRAFT_349072 [Sodiomyces alkalinus F11]